MSQSFSERAQGQSATKAESSLIVRLKKRVLLEHGGEQDLWMDTHWNLTKGDSLLHKDAAAEIERLNQERTELLQALRDVVDCDWAYMGQDADTGNPKSLYCRVQRGRAALGRFDGESRQDQENDRA